MHISLKLMPNYSINIILLFVGQLPQLTEYSTHSLVFYVVNTLNMILRAHNYNMNMSIYLFYSLR